MFVLVSDLISVQLLVSDLCSVLCVRVQIRNLAGVIILNVGLRSSFRFAFRSEFWVQISFGRSVLRLSYYLGSQL